jgi:hypothetical protein
MRFFVLAFAMLAAAPVAADPANGGVLVRAIELRPQNAVAVSDGLGVDAALVPYRGIRQEDCPSGCISASYLNPLYLGLGAFVTKSRGDATMARRDLYGMRATFGAGFGWTPWLLGYAALDLDAMVVTTDLPGGGHHAGPTLGADVRVGIEGQLGSRTLYSIGVAYLGAVAPGTGDNAGGLQLEVALGWRLLDGFDSP